jgi:hypothetical protein
MATRNIQTGRTAFLPLIALSLVTLPLAAAGLVCSAFSSPALAQNPASVTGGEKIIDLQIPANRDWVPTGVILKPGEEVRVQASGTVEAAGSKETRIFYHQVPPTGRDEFQGVNPQPLYPALSLIGKVGEGPVLLIGGFMRWFAGGPYGSGELVLGINDNIINNNSGAWQVRITVFSQPDNPPPPNNNLQVSTSKKGYAPGEPIVVQFFKKGGFAMDTIGIVKTGDTNPLVGKPRGTPETGSFTFDALPKGTYQAIYMNWDNGNNKVESRYDFSVDIVPPTVVNPPTIVNPPTDELQISTSKKVYELNEPIVLRFSKKGGYARDSIGIVKEGATSLVVYKSRGDAETGSFTFDALPRGFYQAIYMNWDRGNNIIESRYDFSIDIAKMFNKPGIIKPPAVPPRIESVSHSAQKTLLAGDVLQITLRGTPGMTAIYDLPPLVKGGKLPEIDRGEYVGSYSVKTGDRLRGGRVTVYLKSNDGDEDFSQARESVSIGEADLVKPPVVKQPEISPRIISVTHDARALLKTGEVLQVTLRGTPGMNATYDLPPIVKGAALYEFNGGEYVGTYKVQGDDRVRGGHVTAYLKSKHGGEDFAQGREEVNIGADRPKPPVVALRIQSVSHNAGGLLTAGEVLQVTLRGTPGMKATFDVPPLIKGAPLYETSRGEYAGTYQVQAGDHVRDGRVTAYLKSTQGEEDFGQASAGANLGADKPKPRPRREPPTVHMPPTILHRPKPPVHLEPKPKPIKPIPKPKTRPKSWSKPSSRPRPRARPHSKPKPAVNRSYAGQWSTTWGDMTLTQDGDHVSGTYTHPWHTGTIDGTLSNGVLTFNWIQSNRPQGGRGTFTLSADGKSFSGSYTNNQADVGSGNWSGTRK